nr:serine/threonine-protein phosphatase [Thermoanaerobaculales bacterium]
PALSGLEDVLTGSLLAAVGLAAVVLSMVRRRGADLLLLSFGLFTLLYGARLFVGSALAPAIGVTGQASAWITSLITYLILVPAWTFFWQLVGDGPYRLNLWWVRLVSVFAVAGVASDLIQARPFTLGSLNNVIVLAGLAVIAFSVWAERRRMTAELRILLVGMTVFGLLAVNENLVPLNILPWTWRGESIGFVVFVACLGLIAARRFVATERSLASVQGELEAATRIQQSILPKDAPEVAGLAVAVRFHPSSAVAGDIYDFLTPAPGTLGVLVADVSGHGVPAALIASMVKVAVRSHADQARRPAELLARVNRTLCGSFEHGFVTAAYVLLDLERREIVAASGGHPFPLLRRATATTVEEIGGRGFLLGRFSDAAYHEERLPLERGDRLLLYTDGIVEARSPTGEELGEQRLRRRLLDSAALSADELGDEVIGEVRRWIGAGRQPEDDLTVVVVDVVDAHAR